MDTIDIRIDVGDVTVLVGGQPVTGRGRVKVAVERSVLVALLGGAPAIIAAPEVIEALAVVEERQPAPVPVEVAEAVPEPSEVVAAPQTLISAPVIDGRRKRKLDAFGDEEIAAKVHELGKGGASRHFAVNELTLNAEIERRGLVVPKGQRKGPKAPSGAKKKIGPSAKKKSSWLAAVDDADLERTLREKTPLAAAELYGVDIKVIYAERSRLGVSKPHGRQTTWDGDGNRKLDSLGIAYKRKLFLEHTDEELADKWGVPLSAIADERRLLLARTQAATTVVVTPHRSLNDISDMDLKVLLASGRSYESIAVEFGTDVQRLNSEARRLRLGATRKQEVVRSLADIGFLLGQDGRASDGSGAGADA